MIDIPVNGPEFKLLTPERAKQYLENKPIYLAIWNQLVPHYFKDENFCNIINFIRTKRIHSAQRIEQELVVLAAKQQQKTITFQEKNRMLSLQQQKKTLFSDTLKEVFSSYVLPKIKNTDIRYKEANQLIGSLSNSLRSPKEKIQEITEITREDVQENLSYLEVYEREFSDILDDLVRQYFIEKDTGNALSEGEKKEYAQQAWLYFTTKHKKDIEKEIIDITAFNTYLHNKNII